MQRGWEGAAGDRSGPSGVPRGREHRLPSRGSAAGAGPPCWKNSSLDFFSLSDTGIQRETVEMHNLQSKLLLICALVCPFAVALGFWFLFLCFCERFLCE